MSKIYSFFMGVAKTIDLFNTVSRKRKKYVYGDNIAAASEALKSDWDRIGLDMYSAIQRRGNK